MMTPCLKMKPSVVVPWLGFTYAIASLSKASTCAQGWPITVLRAQHSTRYGVCYAALQRKGAHVLDLRQWKLLHAALV